MKKRIISTFLAVIFILSFASGANAAVLKQGSRGSEVKRVQERLISLGYLTGKADGVFGAGTKNAVIKFQRAKGLRADGVVGSGTMAKLFALSESTTPKPSNPQTGTAIKRTLRQGSSGSDVLALQKRLNQLGFNCGNPDGSFGARTKQAVINFQRSRGMKADGIVGALTVSKLFEGSVPQNPAPSTPATPPAEEKVEYNGQANALTGKIVILDPGHGGIDSGASRNGVYEKNINLDVAMKTKGMLEEAGARVIMTRDKDATYSLFYRSAFVNAQVLSILIEDKNKEISNLNLEKQDKSEESSSKSLTLDSYRKRLVDAPLEKADKEKSIEALNLQKDETAAKLEEAIAAGNGAEADKLKAQLDSLEAEILKLQAEVSSLNEEIERLQTQIPALEAEIAAIADRITQIDAGIAQAQDRISQASAMKDKFKPYLDKPTEDERFDIYKYIESSGQFMSMNSELAAIFDLEKQYQENLIFISIHVNSTDETETKASGIQVYYRDSAEPFKNNRPYYTSYSDARRKGLAESILGEVNKMSDFSYKYTAPKIEDLSVLRENNVVSTLVEVGFMNNTSNRTLLQKDITREKAAFGIYNGVVEYFK